MAETFKEPDRLQKYFASLEGNIEKATGKTVAQWVKIAKTCPETKPRAGLILWRAFGNGSMGEEDPNKLTEALFAKYAEQRPLYDKVTAFVTKLGAGTLSPRKSYVALYRLKQYGAIKPSKNGLLIGLAMHKYPKSARLIDVKNLGGGERNKKALVLAAAKEFDSDAKALLKAAYDEN
jgi:hypothetical protein